MSNSEERDPDDIARHDRSPTRREFVIAAGMAPVMMGVTGGGAMAQSESVTGAAAITEIGRAHV